MSKVVTGTFSSGTYEYMASLAVAGFQKIARERRIGPESIKKGVAAGVKELLGIIVSAAGDVPGDPEIGAPAYDLASQILRRHHGSLTRNERKRRLARYLAFAQRLDDPRQLGNGGVETAREMRRFFAGLHTKALSAGYGSKIEGEDNDE